MTEKKFLLISSCFILLTGFSLNVWAQEDAQVAEGASEEDPEQAEQAEQSEQSEQTEQAEEAEEAEDTFQPPPPEKGLGFKLRPPPRAISYKELKSRTSQLSRSVKNSEARLKSLARNVIEGKLGRSACEIIFQNEMGSSFKLIRATFALDGAPIFSQTDESGGLGARREIELFNGSIVPGEHTLSVSLEYRGHGYGIFSYLKGYRFKVRSSHTFKIPESKRAKLRVVGHEKGEPNTPLEERPDVRYVERVDSLSAVSRTSVPEPEPEPANPPSE